MNLPVGSEILRLLSESAPQGNGIAQNINPFDAALSGRMGMGGQTGPSLANGGGGMGMLSMLIKMMQGRGQGGIQGPSADPNISRFVQEFRDRALKQRALVDTAMPNSGTIRR